MTAVGIGDVAALEVDTVVQCLPLYFSYPLDRIDVLAAYEGTGRRQIHEMETRANEMCELLGEAEFGELLAKRRRNVKAVADGIVRRDLFVASPFGGD